MSQLQSELYDIFSYTFQLLKNATDSKSRLEVTEEVIKFLELLKNQQIELKLQRHDFTGNFLAWLALQIFAVTLNGELRTKSDLIVEGFLQVLEIHSPQDPLILTELLNIFVESIAHSLGGQYYKRNVDPLFFVKYFDVGLTKPPCDEEANSIAVENSSGIHPAYVFFVMIVDRCLNAIIQMDQTYTFNVLDLLLKMFEFANDDLKRRLLTLIPRLVISLQPSNSWEWDTIHSSLFVYYRQLHQPGDVEASTFESVREIISHIVGNVSGFNQSLAELMFVLSLEVPYSLSQSENSRSISEWVRLSIKLLDHLDLTRVDFDSILPKLISPYHRDFLPLIESYVVKWLEISLNLNEGSGELNSTTTKRIVEQINPAWKLCLNFLEKVPSVAYSSSYFEKLLDYASRIISSGQRITYLLRFKYPNHQFELLGSRYLRALSAVPFMCNECLSDFYPSKYEVLVHYIKTILGLFADCEGPKIEDSYLLEHIFVILALPWNRQYSQEMSSDVKLTCLEGLLNLICVTPPGKSLTYVSALTGSIQKQIFLCEDRLLAKFLNVLILLLFRVTRELVHGIIDTIKTYLMPDKIEALLSNEYIGHKMLCFLSNNCVVERGTEQWELLCRDCDAVGSAVPGPKFALHVFTDYVALKFLEVLQKPSNAESTAKYYLRFSNHSNLLKAPAAVRSFFTLTLHSPSEEEALMNEIICRLVYNLDGEIDKKVMRSIYETLCALLRQSANSVGGLEKKLIRVVDITKRLLRVPYPREMSIFKILMLYFLPAGLDVCGVRILFKMALSSRGKDFNAFCKSNDPHLAKFIVDFMLYKSHMDNVSISSSFTDIMNVLGYKTDDAMSGTCLISSVLTVIIEMCDATQSTHIISELATLFSIDIRQLVDKHYENVFCDVYSLDDERVFSQNLLPLLDKCGIDLDQSIHSKYNQLVCKLILNSKHPLKIMRFLIQPMKHHSESVGTSQRVLTDNFIGCLTVMESTLNATPTSASIFTAKRHIKSVTTFIKMLGVETVTKIQVEILNTLRTCLPLFYETLPKHCAVAWFYFCFNIDAVDAGPLLTTISVHILPLLDRFPEIISTIFHHFVVKNGEHFREQLPQLHFVPCYPNTKMQQVWCVIQSSLLVKKGKCNTDVLTTLQNIYRESAETKIVALQRLRLCLKDHASNLTNSKNPCENVDPLLEPILTCLLDNITHKSNEVKMLCGACLGELGAVDPKKLDFNEASKSYSTHKYDLKADDFSVLCITKIVHCLGKYDDSYTTRVLYSSIQELLRLQLRDRNDSEKWEYLAKFSSNDQRILSPLLYTKYIFKGMKLERNDSNTVSFGYHTIKTPCEWATLWASQMLVRMPSSFHKNVFSTCLSAMRIDLEVMETVLPYILLYALLYCESSDIDLIEREMKYILQWDLSKHRTRPDNLMIIIGESTKSVIHSEASQTKYVAIILDLLDFINQTASDCYFSQASLGTSQDAIETKIKSFVDRFSSFAMSWKSYVQKDHCRSLYYIERGFADKMKLDNLKPLRNIYSNLNDIDGLVGVTKSSTTTPSTEETMVNHMVFGSVQDALSGYERLCSKYDSTNTYRGLIQCYVNINQPSTALAISSQIIHSDKYLKPDIFSEHIEALWNSSCYDETDRVFEELDSDFLSNHSWCVDLIGVLRLMTKNNYSDVLDRIKSIRLGVVNSLCDLNRNGMNLYRQGYWYMVKLHILNDIESISQVQFSIPPKGRKHQGFKEAWSDLDRRLALLPSHGPYLQDVKKSHLQTLDIVFNASKLKLDDREKKAFSSHLGMMWLDSAKRARKKRCLQDAYTCIGIAEKYEPPKLFIELAKYYQAKFETDAAVLVLQQGLNQNENLMNGNGGDDSKIYAKAKLLTASFNVGNMNLDFNDGYTAFKEAAEIFNMEKSFVCLASYLYRQHLTETEPDNTTAKRFIQLDSARNFSKSLLYGTKHIYQSMPCVLSLWLDYGARVAKKLGPFKKDDDSGMMKTLKDFNSLMENNLLCLPTYMFMTAFSQILSRINHRQTYCFDILKLIITQIVVDYHLQAMWSFISVCRTNNTMQKKRAEEICKKIKSSSKDLSKFLKVFNDFTDRLIEISMKRLKYSKQLKLSQINPHLKGLIVAYKHVSIMLPLQRLLTVHISSCKGIEGNKQHTPFPLKPVYITDVRDEVLMLFSIQMPKRLVFLGSDGEEYPLMCKRDDLRLDSRIMEFNSVINSLLRMDSVAEEKNLSIRTYSVVPLNTECGIIEWLSGLLSLKSIITDMYEKLGIPAMQMIQIKKLMLVQKDEVEMSERLRRFVQVILPKHPPVLHKWFFERHPSPDAWYQCKTSFVKSAAVMSIVGYIVGLGDRHGENILLDSKSGEAVHVDFNCLFNRSDFLTFPETVPFRLTHSMVRAMGATGVEGLFVTSCEVTNRVMRHNSDQLLSVMKPFLYDIDVKSNPPRKNASTESNTDDQYNDEARVNIENIEMRLNGVVRSKTDQFAPHRNSKPLSVEGQTRMLIREATSNLNLCQMFAGWAPYM